MPNPIVHFEIGCRDRAGTRSFFSKLFDWQMLEAGPATMINTGAPVTGHITALGHEPHHYTIFYVQVDDVQAYLGLTGLLKRRAPSRGCRRLRSTGFKRGAVDEKANTQPFDGLLQTHQLRAIKLQRPIYFRLCPAQLGGLRNDRSHFREKRPQRTYFVRAKGTLAAKSSLRASH
jgi:hypothetical protein